MKSMNSRSRSSLVKHGTFPLRPLAVAVALSLSPAAALANPTGAVVVNGQVSIHQAGNVLSVTNTPNSIINWQGFSIG
ncbi:MAG: hypothetical protein IT529_16115, partial [Burkholderiales bacterium]|nr:hypothetical protein [Burkholderiales bacterium]